MFPCTQCGVCCQNIGHIKELDDYDRGDGICKYYDINNRICKIYTTRPDICKIDVMYQKVYKTIYTKNEFYLKNVEACNIMQEHFHIDKNYRIRY